MRIQIAAAALTLIAMPAVADELAGGESAGHSAGQFVDQYRYGGTYRTEKTESAEACAALCADDAFCRTWSYMAPGEGVLDRCELKQVIGRAEYRPGTISGVSRRVMDRLKLADTVAPAETADAAPVTAPPVAETIAAPGQPLRLNEPGAALRIASVTAHLDASGDVDLRGDPSLISTLQVSYATLP